IRCLLLGRAAGSCCLRDLNFQAGVVFGLGRDGANRNAGKAPCIVNSLKSHVEHYLLRLGLGMAWHMQENRTFPRRCPGKNRRHEDRRADVDTLRPKRGELLRQLRRRVQRLKCPAWWWLPHQLRSSSRLSAQPLRDVVATLEAAGVEFLPPEENITR